MIRLEGIEVEQAHRVRAELAAEALPYARSDMDALPGVGPMSPERDKQTMLAELESRFVGHSGRAALLRLLRPGPSSGDPLTDEKAAIEERPGGAETRAIRSA